MLLSVMTASATGVGGKEAVLDHLPGGITPILVLFVLALFGTVMGRLFEKLHLPHISGQLFAGILIGTTLFNLLPEESMHEFRHFSDVVLGLMTFTVGTHLNRRVIHNSWRRIVTLAFAEIVLTFTFVSCCVKFLGGGALPMALLLGAIAIETAPGTIISLGQSQKARGMMFKTLIGMVALNNVAAIVVFVYFKPIAMSFAMGNSYSEVFSLTMLGKALIPASCALVTGAVVGGVLSLVLKYSHGRDLILGYGLLAILANLVLCHYLSFYLPGDLSPLLANLVAGVVLSNVSPHTRRTLGSFDHVTEFMFTVFFVMAGTHLDLRSLKVAGVVGTVFVLARIAAKYGATFGISKTFGYPDKIKNYLGLALIPQAGLAVGLVISLGNMPGMQGTEFMAILSTVVLSAVAVNEVVGPFTTMKSFKLAGETGQGNPRLVDFLHEEFIMMPLEAEDKWDAIGKLTKFLHWTHHLHNVSVDEIETSVVDREKEMSTGLGDQIAIPHARMTLSNTPLMGVIGVLKKPIDFDAIDEEPVDIIILIVTPEKEVELHLKVCQQVAKIFGQDPVLHNRIVNARDAAEVYDLLQSREVREMNVFLDLE